ncbi:MAG: right-handed parallel beta-helix repeat-containing protein [Planctomycetes bacterium]|nr:right-handed parallel beta-helix repeat-containing protein [Planctomycetota bacterium]
MLSLLRRVRVAALLALVIGVCASRGAAQSWLPSSVYPPWATTPARTISLDYDSTKSDTENGARLAAAIRALVPGDGLEIGSGRWSIVSKIDVTLQGTEENPIWIFGKNPFDRPIITRPDAKQNCFNVGEASQARYLVLKDLEITGGSYLLNMVHCDHMWVHRCFIHDGEGVGISTQRDCSYIYITNNTVKNPGPGTLGEAMYIGSSTASYITSWSVIAYNHVYDTLSATNGDGIELKQKCHHNWVIGNIVHDTNYPCILVYGTDGNGINVVERNICWNSQNEVLQVQGEAIVRNNICINGGTTTFSSSDHFAQTTDIRVTNNTFINTGDAALLGQWSGKPGMVFANNACYSKQGRALRFGQITTGVTVVGNVVFGQTSNIPIGSDLRLGNGLEDFFDVAWDASTKDVRPMVASPMDGRGVLRYSTPRDANGSLRKLPLDIGAVESQDSFGGDIASIAATTGGTQTLTIDAGTSQAGRIYLVLGSTSGLTPGFDLAGYTVPLTVDTWLGFTLANANRAYLGKTLGFLDAKGRAVATVSLPPLSQSMIGTVFAHTAIVMDGLNFNYVTNVVTLSVL